MWRGAAGPGPANDPDSAPPHLSNHESEAYALNTNRIDLPGVYRRAALIIQTNGHHQGDYVPDPLNRVLTTPKLSRPMSLPAALYCAAEPQGRMYISPLAQTAMVDLANRVLVDGEGPWGETHPTDCEIHLHAWGDVEGRTSADVIALLLAAAEDVDREAHAAVIPVGVRTPDGAVFELASVGADGTPHYVLAGCQDASASVFAELSELVSRFGAVSASGRAA